MGLRAPISKMANSYLVAANCRERAQFKRKGIDPSGYIFVSAIRPASKIATGLSRANGGGAKDAIDSGMKSANISGQLTGRLSVFSQQISRLHNGHQKLRPIIYTSLKP